MTLKECTRLAKESRRPDQKWEDIRDVILILTYIIARHSALLDDRNPPILLKNILHA